jgi:hypothetical protein
MLPKSASRLLIFLALKKIGEFGHGMSIGVFSDD